MPRKPYIKASKPHDTGYKRLFSHPELVEGLIKGFVEDPWLQGLDFSTLERLPNSYITDDMRELADDVVWRVKTAEDDWLYLYILIEFQSTIDPFMAVRIMTYVGLLYQDLIRQNKLTKGSLLPPVLPVVLYNGVQRWDAALDIYHHLPKVPTYLQKFCPHLRYLLIEEQAYADTELAALHNVTAAIFRFEKITSPEQASVVIDELKNWLQDPKLKELRRSIALWVHAALVRHKDYATATSPEVNDLQEISIMFAENMKLWAERHRDIGWQQGIQKGKLEGMQEGIQKGKLEGVQEGIQKGKQEGRQEGRQEGERLVLQRLLERKFGPLHREQLTLLNKADAETLLTWSERILTATTVAEVLTPIP